jgi:hypothetical protein
VEWSEEEWEEESAVRIENNKLDKARVKKYERT